MKMERASLPCCKSRPLRLLLLLGEDQELPAHWSSAWRVLMVILRREGVSLRNSDLVATLDTAIDTWVFSRLAWSVKSVERSVIG